MLVKNKLNSLRLIAILVLLLIVGCPLILVFYYRAYVLVVEPSSSNVLLFNEVQTNTFLPVRLIIPRLDIDTNVDHVGLALDGTMDVPTLPENAAWFNAGARPGEIGSAVIDGHAGWRDGKPAVFDYLYKMRKGDNVYVEDENGLITTFVVYKKETYKEDDDSSDVFISKDQGVYLNLITCSGNWDKVERKHADRLVVFTKKEI